ncbi:hypothetical protein EJE24_22640 [Enterobacter huaxiensis]|uniref:Fimbrial-type adhesion domain-containing protein n=1 Tax=Enterobacter huaxiensis TaxID=2494702 RepID=A0A3R9PRU6_9ENTR|nr:fimbrial protein [Enterobacter huaxiensis]RSK63147.1 hypothetical protein EJE24_22640 [Enterobacter huaxiensis]
MLLNKWLNAVLMMFTLSMLLVISGNKAYALICNVDIPVRMDSFQLQGGNITVGNELPNGTILYQQRIQSSKDYANAPHGLCDNSGPYTDIQYAYLTSTPNGLSAWQGGSYSGKIYNTNIPGIGVVINVGYANGLNTTKYKWYEETRSAIANIQVWTTASVIFIKTGDVSPGILNGASLPTVRYQNDYTTTAGQVMFTWNPYTFNFSGALNVVSRTCDVSSYSVSLGSWNVKVLEKNGLTEWRDASVKMSGCPRFYGYMSNPFTTEHLTGKNTTAISYTPNAFGLHLSPLYGTVNAAQGLMNIEPDTNAAKGVAIQIASGSSASNALFNLGSEQRIIAPDDGRAEISIPLVARYIKTDENVSAGKADGKVVFTINYY